VGFCLLTNLNFHNKRKAIKISCVIERPQHERSAKELLGEELRGNSRLIPITLAVLDIDFVFNHGG
jgi:hypothetical protein